MGSGSTHDRCYKSEASGDSKRNNVNVTSISPGVIEVLTAVKSLPPK